VALYARLLGRSIRRQTSTVGQLEIKAELLDILPTGVALLDEEGILKRQPDLLPAFWAESSAWKTGSDRA
jgi:hypothetical protein